MIRAVESSTEIRNVARQWFGKAEPNDPLSRLDKKLAEIRADRRDHVQNVAVPVTEGVMEVGASAFPVDIMLLDEVLRGDLEALKQRIPDRDDVAAAGGFGAIYWLLTGRKLRSVDVPNSALVRGSNPSRLVFEGMEFRAVRNLSHVDESTLRTMARDGFAAKDINGKKLHLHHLNQNPNGPIVEIPSFRHNAQNPVQHSLGTAPGVGLTKDQREAFDGVRVRYWKERAIEELSLRGLTP